MIKGDMSRSKNLFKINKNTYIKLSRVIKPKSVAIYGKKLTRIKKDCVICVTGPTGEGKSVIACEIAKNYDKRFTYERNLIYSREELKEKIETFPPSAFVIDEAINLVYKREWNNSGQKDLIKILNICRSKGHLIIFIQPEFIDMDKDIRNIRIRLWIYVASRGLGICLRPIRTLSGLNDPWFLKENNVLVNKFVGKLGDIVGIAEGSFRSKNFISFIKWDDMDKKEYEVYNEIKDKKKYGDENKEALLTKKEADKLAKEKVIDMIWMLRDKLALKRGFLGYIANELSVSQTWLTNKLKEVGLKRKIINNQGYDDLDNKMETDSNIPKEEVKDTNDNEVFKF